MKTLLAHANGTEEKELVLAAGQHVRIHVLNVTFPSAKSARLPSGLLPCTYSIKPLVQLGGRALFGELAIVACLQADGWDAVWVDIYHGGKFWRAMPSELEPVALPQPARDQYERILAANGGRRGGFFDVIRCHVTHVVVVSRRPCRAATAAWVALPFNMLNMATHYCQAAASMSR